MTTWLPSTHLRGPSVRDRVALSLAIGVAVVATAVLLGLALVAFVPGWR